MKNMKKSLKAVLSKMDVATMRQGLIDVSSAQGFVMCTEEDYKYIIKRLVLNGYTNDIINDMYHLHFKDGTTVQMFTIEAGK